MIVRLPRRSMLLSACVSALALVTVVPLRAEAMPLPVTLRVVIGHSAQGREIVAYHRYTVGAPGPRTFLVIGQMHGNEETGKSVVAALRAQALPSTMDLWLIPTINPDGDAANIRVNAHKVDLNRNFAASWIKQGSGTSSYSGASAGSEPETKAVSAFLLSVKPWRTVSFHTPLNGVDTSPAKDPALGRDLSAWSGYATKSFTCTTGCHGTMTQFINAKTPGAAVTFEFGPTTTSTQLNKVIAAVIRVGSP